MATNPNNQEIPADVAAGLKTFAAVSPQSPPSLQSLIDEAVRLSEAATEGPWRWISVAGGWDGVGSGHGEIAALRLNVPDNAVFIARARTLVPELVGVVQELQAMLALLDAPETEIIGAPVYMHNGYWFARHPSGDETLDTSHQSLFAALRAAMQATAKEG